MPFKLSITAGPMVNGSDEGMALATRHCAELAVLLCDWYETLPVEVASHVEVITVNPKRVVHGSRVQIKVVLSGVYVHNIQGGGQEPLEWKNHLVEVLYWYRPSDDSLFAHRNKKDLVDALNVKLVSLFEFEIQTYRELLAHFEELSLGASKL